ncbi:hypothetical protein CCM_01229 [Cordyceps militaris CM01]|uniref:Uncharacterized protein n=1 Tax=Cordyceps militaris (strain CM01) TaxID=983644 RepID=G3J3U7_CORMM|nr:uncharacterized protein CCM_01229 [Cordyceps militaris CM01]EGX96572.1 hypothetical protein CCM_01229 [Cordyceps militaris CM01]
MPASSHIEPIYDTIHSVYPGRPRLVLGSTFSISNSRRLQHIVMEETTVEDSLKRVILGALPKTRVQSVQATAAAGLHRIYRATTQDGGIIQCSLPPSPNRLILRCEYGSIRSEAAVLQWLSWLGKGRPESDSPKSKTVDFEEDKKEARNRIRVDAISEYLPKLLDHGVSGSLHPLQYNVILPRPGRLLSMLAIPLTAAERRSIDFQIGQMLRGMSLLRSPASRFGNAENMLPPAPQRSSSAQCRASLQAPSESFTKWSDAFGHMLQSAIQDAQANQITASYDSIRRLLHRFTHVLDGVLEPRLVFVDAGLDKNVLVAMQEAESDEPGTSESDNVTADELDSSESESSGSAATPVKVTGLREWIKPVFGDPLMSVIFCQAPSESLLRGFCTSLPDTLDDMDEVSESLCQKRQHAQIRLNLYRIYHALNAISVEYIRRDVDSDPRELRARKALVEAVRELEALDEAETSKRRRRCLEVTSSKRHKTLSP